MAGDRHSMTDAEWSALQRTIAAGRQTPERWSDRKGMNGIFSVLRTTSPWPRIASVSRGIDQPTRRAATSIVRPGTPPCQAPPPTPARGPSRAAPGPRSPACASPTRQRGCISGRSCFDLAISHQARMSPSSASAESPRTTTAPAQAAIRASTGVSPSARPPEGRTGKGRCGRSGRSREGSEVSQDKTARRETLLASGECTKFEASTIGQFAGCTVSCG